MKKSIILGILLAIASITVAQNWKTITLPFSGPTDVTALLAYDNHYVAFGTNGKNLLAYYDSTNTVTVSYADNLWWSKTPNLAAQKAYKTKGGLAIIIGDAGLLEVSKDSGKVWADYHVGDVGNLKLLVETPNSLVKNLPFLYFLDENGNGFEGQFNLFGDFNVNYLSWENEPKDRLAPVCGFSGKNGAAILMPETPANTKDVLNGIRCSLYSFGTLGNSKGVKTHIPSGDSVVAGLSDNETINLLAVNNTGSYFLYKSDGKDILGKTEITSVIAGDNFISYGYTTSNKIGYFIGQNKNGQVIRVGTDNSRQVLAVDITPTCLATKGDTLIIGGKDGKIIIAEKIWTSLTVQKKLIQNILAKQGNSIIITGEGNEVSWRVISPLGKIMGIGNNREINLLLPSGVYLVEIKIDKNLVIQKTIF